jgi:thioredoxin reductase (NADPH)
MTDRTPQTADKTPVILTVDDEPEVLRAVQRDLRSRYAADYRVVGATGGQEAIDAIKELALRETPLALILADQRMPQVTGVDVIRASLDLFPNARKALLTAYADTDVAISAINDVKPDHYILKPWDPPEEKLYPILDDLLEDWQADYRPTFEGIRVVATEWSKEAFERKAFLAMNQVPYKSLTIGFDAEAEKLMETAGAGLGDLPLFLFPEGDPLIKPSTQELADRVGLQSHASQPAYDLAIVGAGPAGLAAAVYGASEGLKTILIEASAPGGQAAQSTLIENYLGFPGASAGRPGTTGVLTGVAPGAEVLSRPKSSGSTEGIPLKILHFTDGTSITAKAVVVTSGVQYRRLEAEGLEELTERGLLRHSPTSKPPTTAHQPMFVVGGEPAGQVTILSRFTDSVSIVIHGEDLSESMSQYLIDNIAANDAVSPGLEPS